MSDPDRISISILLATRNRASSLLQTLDSLFTSANLANQDWEVVVVDNSSNDNTSIVCRKFAETYPGQFQFLYEGHGGKSCALNTGIRLCRGSILVLIDDDVLCDSRYLHAIRASVANNRDAIIQGRVFVDYHGELPPWFDEYFASMLCKIDLGDRVRDLPLPRQLWGLNAVLPIEAMVRVGGFCTELGPGASGFADDCELSRRLRKAGYQVIYDPGLLVRHQIWANRLTIPYVLRRSFATGVSASYYEQKPPVPLWRYTIYLTKQILLSVPALLLNIAKGQWGSAMRRLCAHAVSLGFLTQHWKFRKAGAPNLVPPMISIAQPVRDETMSSAQPSRS